MNQTKLEIDLAVTDIDGTLVDQHKVITERSHAAIKAMALQGTAFAACSGRLPLGMTFMLDDAGITLPFGALNGGVILDRDMNILHQQPIGPRRAAKAIRVLQEQDMIVWVYTALGWYVSDSQCHYTTHEEHVVRTMATEVKDFTPLLPYIIKISGISRDHEKVARLETELQQTMGANLSVVRSNDAFLDISHKNANKGFFVRWIAKHVGKLKGFKKNVVPKSGIITLGDMPSDACMFPHCGISVAMGQAPETVRRAATHVVPSNRDEGWAIAIETLVLR